VNTVGLITEATWIELRWFAGTPPQTGSGATISLIEERSEVDTLRSNLGIFTAEKLDPY